jgi:hypothetical protein
MTRLPPSRAFGLSRRTQGLPEAHKQLIRLLAEKAVSDYLAETDAANEEDRA